MSIYGDSDVSDEGLLIRHAKRLPSLYSVQQEKSRGNKKCDKEEEEKEEEEERHIFGLFGIAVKWP